jgi:hypothetical protein
MNGIRIPMEMVETPNDAVVYESESGLYQFSIGPVTTAEEVGKFPARITLTYDAA